MLAINWLLVLVAHCQWATAAVVDSRLSSAINQENSSIYWLTRVNNERFVEQTLVLNESYYNAIDRINTKIAASYLIEPSKLDYPVLKLVSAIKNIHFVIVKDRHGYFFIARLKVNSQGYITYDLLIKTRQVILDMTYLSLDSVGLPSANQPQFYLYWLEKNESITVYQARYQFGGERDDEMSEVKVLHQFGWPVGNASIIAHEPSHQIYIAALSPMALFFLRLQFLTKPAVPLLQASRAFNSSYCRFLSDLHHWGHRGLLLLFDCQVANSQGTRRQPHYMRVNIASPSVRDVLFDDTLASAGHKLPAFHHFHRQWQRLISRTDNRGVSSIMNVVPIDEWTNVFFYNRNEGRVCRSGRIEGEIRMYSFSRLPGSLFLLKQSRLFNHPVGSNQQGLNIIATPPVNNKQITVSEVSFIDKTVLPSDNHPTKPAPACVHSVGSITALFILIALILLGLVCFGLLLIFILAIRKLS